MRWKVIGTVLFFICAISIFFCGVVAVNIFKDWSRDVIYAENVFETGEFEDLFNETVNFDNIAVLSTDSAELIRQYDDFEGVKTISK
mgnify:CR=1 FL=1